MSTNNTLCIVKGQSKMYRVFEQAGASYLSAMKINKEASKRLRELRIDRGYSYAETFAKTHNISETTYRSHENGSRNISLGAAKKYAKLLGTTAYWILDGAASGDLPKQKHISDSDVGLLDALKLILLILGESGACDLSRLHTALTYQAKVHDDEGRPDAAEILKALREYVNTEHPQSERKVLSRLLHMLPRGSA
jgi:DNA-binding XRE family transcriptional regulator